MHADNLRIARSRPLIAPAVLSEEIPMTAALEARVTAHRTQIADIIHGRDDRWLVVVGPCSVHDLDAVSEYAERLAPLARTLSERIEVVMRVYFEKPRTTVGWKGLINDPDLDEQFNVNKGLRMARTLLKRISELDLPCATEFLDTTFGQFYTDFISWGAIGARTVESQVHRQLASGLSMPVGIKNATNGSYDVAIDAIAAANRPHVFPSLTKEGAPALLETRGNPDCHLVLRGGSQPNYMEAAAARDALTARDIRTGLMVDLSHANSRKQPERQIEIAEELIRARAPISGLMIESHLVAGRQDTPEIYGCSITDACIGWDDTERLLHAIAERR